MNPRATFEVKRDSALARMTMGIDDIEWAKKRPDNLVAKDAMKNGTELVEIGIASLVEAYLILDMAIKTTASPGPSATSVTGNDAQ